MVTLLAFVVLGGGAAYAANTVFSSDIVNGEVKQPDIAAQAVGTDQVKNNPIGTNDITPSGVATDEIANGAVRSADVQNDGLTGADILESSLQNVDAGTVDGLQVRKINFRVPFGTGPTTVLDLAGLQITAECQGFGDGLDVKAFTSKNDAGVYYTAMSARASMTQMRFRASTPTGWRTDSSMPVTSFKSTMRALRLETT